MIRRAQEAFNRRDVEAFLELVHPDIEFQTRALPGVYRGHDGMRRYFEEWVVEPWAALRVEIENLEILTSDVALLEIELHGKSRDTGVEVQMQYWEVVLGDGGGRLLNRTVFIEEQEAREEAIRLARA